MVFLHFVTLFPVPFTVHSFILFLCFLIVSFLYLQVPYIFYKEYRSPPPPDALQIFLPAYSSRNDWVHANLFTPSLCPNPPMGSPWPSGGIQIHPPTVHPLHIPAQSWALCVLHLYIQYANKHIATSTVKLLHAQYRGVAKYEGKVQFIPYNYKNPI